MIKHFILTAFTLLFCLSINAQLTDVATDVNVPTGIALQGNNLYISEYDGYKISRIDITEANPIAVNVVTGITNPANLAFNGDFLYIAEPYANRSEERRVGKECRFRCGRCDYKKKRERKGRDEYQVTEKR